ncbi:MAG: hypothetical protein ACTSVL_12215 [Promethearchaeota archaeon]
MSSQSKFQALECNQVKKSLKLAVECPLCHKKIRIGVEHGVIDNVENFPYPHAVLHGNPLHALIVFIDRDMNVRAKEVAESIEIKRDSDTFAQLMKKWTNPF